jgi:hypothetical protein
MGADRRSHHSHLQRQWENVLPSVMGVVGGVGGKVGLDILSFAYYMHIWQYLE